MHSVSSKELPHEPNPKQTKSVFIALFIWKQTEKINICAVHQETQN